MCLSFCKFCLTLETASDDYRVRKCRLESYGTHCVFFFKIPNRIHSFILKWNNFLSWTFGLHKNNVTLEPSQGFISFGKALRFTNFEKLNIIFGENPDEQFVVSQFPEFEEIIELKKHWASIGMKNSYIQLAKKNDWVNFEERRTVKEENLVRACAGILIRGTYQNIKGVIYMFIEDIKKMNQDLIK